MNNICQAQYQLVRLDVGDVCPDAVTMQDHDNAAAEWAEHWRGIPLIAAMDIAPLSASSAAGRALLPANAVTASEEGAVDVLALLPFIDQLGSLPLMVAARGTAMATVELDIALIEPPAPGAVTGVARALSVDGASRLVVAEATDARGTPVAAASLWFSVGAPPGGGSDTRPAETRAVSREGPLARTLGMTADADARVLLAPGVWETVGWTGLPAMHGGAVAVALAMAAQARVAAEGRADLRLAQINIRFLRAATLAGGHAAATVDTIGRRTARLSSEVVIAGERVASAQLLFVAR